MVGKGLPWKGLSVHQVLQDNDSYTTRAKNVYTNVQTSRVSVSIQICAKSGMRVTTLKEFCRTALQRVCNHLPSALPLELMILQIMQVPGRKVRNDQDKLIDNKG